MCARAVGRYLRLAPACAQPADGAGSSAKYWRRWLWSSGTSCLPLTWDTAASGAGGSIPGAVCAATAASTVNAATAATTGLARPQPDPALRCRQAGISVDALRALATALELAPTRRPHRRAAGIGLRRATPLHDSATAEKSRTCDSASLPLRASEHVCSTAERVTARHPPAHVHTRCIYVLETWPCHHESGHSWLGGDASRVSARARCAYAAAAASASVLVSAATAANRDPWDVCCSFWWGSLSVCSVRAMRGACLSLYIHISQL